MVIVPMKGHYPGACSWSGKYRMYGTDYYLFYRLSERICIVLAPNESARVQFPITACVSANDDTHLYMCQVHVYGKIGEWLLRAYIPPFSSFFFFNSQSMRFISRLNVSFAGSTMIDRIK